MFLRMRVLFLVSALLNPRVDKFFLWSCSPCCCSACCYLCCCFMILPPHGLHCSIFPRNIGVCCTVRALSWNNSCLRFPPNRARTKNCFEETPKRPYVVVVCAKGSSPSSVSAVCVPAWVCLPEDTKRSRFVKFECKRLIHR